MRILLADDRPLIALGVEQLLRGTQHQLLTIARSIEEAMRKIAESEPDLVLLDNDLTEGMGIRIVDQLTTQDDWPKIVLLTPGLPEGQVAKLIAQGVDGIVDKRSSPDVLLECLDEIERGSTYVDPRISAPGAAAPVKDRTGIAALTSRELDIVNLVTQGLRNREIASSLGITEGTVKVYLHGIFEKTRVASRTELAFLASGPR